MVPAAWRRLVSPRHEPAPDRRAYTLCTMERLQDSLRRRDFFVSRSERWADPRIKLLQGAQWETVRPQVCRALGRSESPEPELDALAQQLDVAYQRTANNFASNDAVRIELVKGRDTLTVTGLDKLEEPASLVKLREQVMDRLPRVDLPEVLLEIHARTGFAHEFNHISEGAARAVDLPTSLCAVLLAEACNIGLEPVAHADIAALTRRRLSWIQQNYIPG